jgi:hypothetical protein
MEHLILIQTDKGSRAAICTCSGKAMDDRWAYPVDSNTFTLLSDPGTTFQEFCAFCQIESPPPVQGVIA